MNNMLLQEAIGEVPWHLSFRYIVILKLRKFGCHRGIARVADVGMAGPGEIAPVEGDVSAFLALFGLRTQGDKEGPRHRFPVTTSGSAHRVAAVRRRRLDAARSWQAALEQTPAAYVPTSGIASPWSSISDHRVSSVNRIDVPASTRV